MTQEDRELRDQEQRLLDAEAEASKPDHLRRPQDPTKPPNFLAPYSVIKGASPFDWMFGFGRTKASAG